MKRILISLLALCFAHLTVYSQYILNQTDVIQTADALISGKFASGYLQTFRGTSVAGEHHYSMFGGTKTPAGGNLRWSILLQNNETGSNAGADFRIFSFNDDGTKLGNPLSIIRSTGMVTAETGMITPFIGTNNSAGAISIIGGATAPNSYRGAEIIFRGGNNASTPGEMTFHTGAVSGGNAQPERMRINASGLVTMGYELAVKGTITAMKVKVTLTGWSDYVFHKDYQLPSLQDVEKYVNAHQHLEGIPSAAEVAKDGIDVGEMNKKLLAKVEELTLYLIEQNKKIIALEEWKKKQEAARL